MTQKKRGMTIENARLAKWVVELGEQGITYQPRLAIKGQVLDDFIMEGATGEQHDKLVLTNTIESPNPEWMLYTKWNF
ncbi:hypothetical protein E3N88_39682 [Mikania micrantha]|uniref:Uncharacterized protein n=1 Tax=Mikania micrantha TaxID=192012 RepID=A0A5N6LKH4_9ASTR|nr:hypothetical protein E3N88_39682 [Mikania micrantha]